MITPESSRTSIVWSQNRTYTVYAHLAADGTYLYVGQTTNLAARTKSHKSREWWPQVAEVAILGKTTDREAARDMESAYIAEFAPPWNKQRPATECPHGTVTGYGLWRCRCDDCKRAHYDYSKAHRAAHRRATELQRRAQERSA